MVTKEHESILYVGSARLVYFCLLCFTNLLIKTTFFYFPLETKHKKQKHANPVFPTERFRVATKDLGKVLCRTYFLTGQQRVFFSLVNKSKTHGMITK